MSTFPPRCYYCDSQNFGSVNDYERHIVMRHPNLPGYPKRYFYAIFANDLRQSMSISLSSASASSASFISSNISCYDIAIAGASEVLVLILRLLDMGSNVTPPSIDFRYKISKSVIHTV